MGCDIHAHVEVKLNNTWHHYSAPKINRWYALFAKMCGVRSNGTEIPIKLPDNKIPEDATVLTAHDYTDWDADAHSLTVFGLKELQELREWYVSGKPDVFEFDFRQHFCLPYIDWIGSQDVDYQDIRMIFWFDN